MRVLLIAFLLFLFQTTIYSQTFWEPIDFPDTLTPSCINAEKDGLLLTWCAGVGIARSNDEGDSWEVFPLDNTQYYFNVFKIKYDNDGVLFLGSGLGIFRSYDDGESFEKVTDFNTDNVLNIGISPENHIYTVGWGPMLRSIDHGESWEIIEVDNNGIGYQTDVDFGLNGEIYVVGGRYHTYGGGFYRSLDNGETWENIGLTGVHIRSIEVSQEGNIIVGGFGLSKVYISEDQGVSWIEGGHKVTDVMVTYADDRLIAGRNVNYNAGCWRSEDWGMSWTTMVDTVLFPAVIQDISVAFNYRAFVQTSTFTETFLYRSTEPLIVEIENRAVIKELSFYPNPVSDYLYFTNTNPGKSIHYVIYNISGKLISLGKTSEAFIDMTEFRDGMFIVKIKSGNQTLNTKIIKQSRN